MNKCFPATAKFEKYGSQNGSMLVRILEDFKYISSVGVITVPKGFISDGASVPRGLWNIFSPFDGEYFDAALIHDYLYSKMSSDTYPEIDRQTADAIFKEAMYNLDVNWMKRGTIYLAVRAGGWASYKKK